MIKMTVSQPTIKMKIEPAKVVYSGGGAPYEGAYEVTPKADSAVVLPTKDRFLNRDVNVKKIPYYETSNQTGVTVYIAAEV